MAGQPKPIDYPTARCPYAANPGHNDACPACEGTGLTPGRHCGAFMLMEREAAGVSRGALQRHFYKPQGTTFSIAYICDLEGVGGAYRRWTPYLCRSYRAAIAAAVAEQT